MKQVKLIFMVLLSLIVQLSFAQVYTNGSNITYTWDNFGIGLNNPDGRLHVNGGARINDWLRVGGNTDGYTWKVGVNGNMITRQGTVALGVEANDKVGIGTTTPQYKLQTKGDVYVDGGWLRVAGSKGVYFQNYGGGFHMIDNTWIRTYNNKSFYHNTGIMRTDGTFQVGPHGNRFIVNASGLAGIGTTDPKAGLHIVKNSTPPSSLPSGQNGLLLGSKSISSYKWMQSYGGVLSLNPVGNNVSIGSTASTGYKLYVNGNAAKPGSSFWSIASDRRFKKDIHDFKDGLDVLKEIRPVWFRYNEKSGINREEAFVGVIAQEVEKAAPYMVTESEMEDETGKKTSYLSYDANALLYILVNSVQEQQEQLEKKDAKLETLTNEINELKQLVQQLVAEKNEQSQIHIQTEKVTDVVLEQNRPNPFSQNTTIEYNIPTSVKEAVIVITAINGQPVKTISIENRGVGEVMLEASTLSPGTYSYTLVLDGKVVETKRMVLTNRP